MSFGAILENPSDSYDEVYYMNPCIAQDPLVASGEELKEHKATKSWIKMGIYLPWDDAISQSIFMKISATTQLISDHLEITSVLKISHSITLGINLEGFDSILGIGGCFHDLGEHFGA